MLEKYINTDGYELYRLKCGLNVSYVGEFIDGVAITTLASVPKKENFVREDGTLVSEIWFQTVDIFIDGLARVKLHEEFAFMNIDGKIVSSFYEYAENFRNGFAIVRKNWQYNFIRPDGTLLSNVWFDSLTNFSDGHATAEKYGCKYRFDCNMCFKSCDEIL